MDEEKVKKFYEIILQNKGRYPIRKNHYNDEYREQRVYNFWIELDETFIWLWLLMQRLYYSFVHPLFEIKPITITFDRLISMIAFCPPYDTYVYNFNSNDNNSNGEILLSHFVASSTNNNNNNNKLHDIYQRKFIRMVKYFECFYAYNQFGNRIACIFIRKSNNKKSMVRRTIVYSHANGEDIGTILCHLWKMKRKFKKFNIFSYDYSGYGMSSGSPSERNIYADIEAAINELIRRKNLNGKDLILFGESIGSSPTIYMAANKKIDARAVILQSSFMSGIRIYFPYNMNGSQTLPFDPFANIKRCSQIKCPTLVIHGSEDALVSIDHAIQIYEHLSQPVTPFWANGASHMNIHKHSDYYDRINDFFASLY